MKPNDEPTTRRDFIGRHWSSFPVHVPIIQSDRHHHHHHHHHRVDEQHSERSIWNDSDDKSSRLTRTIRSTDMNQIHQRQQQPRPKQRKTNDGDIRKSAYVCEDGTLHLSCADSGKHIDVLRANFGRFSITLCNPSGFLDWSVNCASGNSLPVLIQRYVPIRTIFFPYPSHQFSPCKYKILFVFFLLSFEIN